MFLARQFMNKILLILIIQLLIHYRQERVVLRIRFRPSAGTPFAVLALPPCPFRFRRSSLPLPFSSSTHCSSPPNLSSPLAPDPLVPSPSISSASPRLALAIPRHPSHYRRSNDKDVLCKILETEKDALCKILEKSLLAYLCVSIPLI